MHCARGKITSRNQCIFHHIALTNLKLDPLPVTHEFIQKILSSILPIVLALRSRSWWSTIDFPNGSYKLLAARILQSFLTTRTSRTGRQAASSVPKHVLPCKETLFAGLVDTSPFLGTLGAKPQIWGPEREILI